MSPTMTRSNTSIALRVVLTVVALCLIITVVTPSFSSSEEEQRAHVLQKRGAGDILALRQLSDLLPLPSPQDAGSSTSPTTTDEPTTSTTSTRRVADPPITTTSTSTSTSTSVSITTDAATNTTTTDTATATDTETTDTATSSSTRNRESVSYRSASRVTSSSAAASSTQAPADPGDTPFLTHKGAVAATFTVVGLVVVGALIFMAFHIRKRIKESKKGDDDMWEDGASMAEFASRDGGRQSMLVGGSINRHNTTSSHYGTYEDPDMMLSMPPVAAHEANRDSAYDISPSAPPPSSFNISKGRRPGADTTSFGSGVGNDPFAGTGFVDATREGASTPSGGAGIGAGYSQQPHY